MFWKLLFRHRIALGGCLRAFSCVRVLSRVVTGARVCFVLSRRVTLSASRCKSYRSSCKSSRFAAIQLGLFHIQSRFEDSGEPPVKPDDRGQGSGGGRSARIHLLLEGSGAGTESLWMAFR